MKNTIANWAELPLILNPEILRSVLPLGRDGIYALWNVKGFPGLRLGKKLIVGRRAFQKWLENSQ
jgi:hypothetical protein